MRLGKCLQRDRFCVGDVRVAAIGRDGELRRVSWPARGPRVVGACIGWSGRDAPSAGPRPAFDAEAVLLEHLRAATTDTSSDGSSPVARARTGSEHHLLNDSAGIPLAVGLTGGHRNDVTRPLPLVDGVGPVRGKVGRPRRRAERVLADRRYEHDKYRRLRWNAVSSR